MNKNTMRIYRASFSHCHFIHIPAIEHGFYTEGIWVFAYTAPRRGKPRPLPLHMLRVDPKTYAVDIAFIGPKQLGKTNNWRYKQRLLPIQHVTIEIHGPAPVSPPRPRKPSTRAPRRAKPAEPLVCTIVANGRIVGETLVLLDLAAEEFTHLPIKRHRWRLQGETKAISAMTAALAPSFVHQDSLLWEFRSPHFPHPYRYHACIHDLLQEDVEPGKTARLSLLLWINIHSL